MYDLWNFPVGNVVSKKPLEICGKPKFFWMNLDFTIPDLRIYSPANLFRHLALWAHVQLGCKECTTTDICPKFKKSKCCCEGAIFVCNFWPRFWTLKRLTAVFFFCQLNLLLRSPSLSLLRQERSDIPTPEEFFTTCLVARDDVCCTVTRGDWFIEYLLPSCFDSWRQVVNKKTITWKTSCC